MIFYSFIIFKINKRIFNTKYVQVIVSIIIIFSSILFTIFLNKNFNQLNSDGPNSTDEYLEVIRLFPGQPKQSEAH